MPTPIVVLESLEAPLRRKWIEFLIENDHIAFEPSQANVGSPRKSYHSARIRLIRPAIAETTTADQRRIVRALQSLREREAEGKPVPPYAKFCVLLSSSMDDSSDYASSSSRTPSKRPPPPDGKNSEATSVESVGGGGDGNPRKRSIEWVSRKIDQIFAAKEASLREEQEQEHGTISSTNHIFPVFVYDFLTKTFGLTSLVNRNSMDLIFSLHHQRDKSDYLTLFARFLDEVYDEDDLLFYFHAKDAVLRHKRGGMDFPFTRKEEIFSFSSIAHAGADFLKKAFNDQTTQLVLPCDVHSVLLMAVESYHDVRTGSTPIVSPHRTEMTPATPAERATSSSTITPVSRGRDSARRPPVRSPSESRSRLSSNKPKMTSASVKPKRQTQTAVPKPGTVAHQRVKQQSLGFDGEDDRTLDEIYYVQERIKEQLEAALSSSNGTNVGGGSGGRRSTMASNKHSPNGFQYVSPSKWREEFPPTTDDEESMDDQYGGTSSSLKQQDNGFTQRRVLPLIQTTRSPEDSSASSASPRSFASPSHQYVQTVAGSTSSPAANRRGFFSSASPLHQKYSSPGGSGPATTRIGGQSSFFESNTKVVDHQSSTKSMMSEVNIEEVQQQFQTHLSIGKDDSSTKVESASSSSKLPPPPQTTTIMSTTNEEEEEEEFASALMTPSGGKDEKEEASSSKPDHVKLSEDEKREGEAPIVALQRAIAKSGSAYLDKFMASLSTPTTTATADVPSPSSPSSMSNRFAIRKEAMNVLSKKTSRVVDQIVAAGHSHVPEDCSHTYCPYADLRAAFGRIVKLSQSKKSFSDEVQDLARRIVDSAMIRREMDALKKEKLAGDVASSTTTTTGAAAMATPIKSTIPKQ